METRRVILQGLTATLLVGCSPTEGVKDTEDISTPEDTDESSGDDSGAVTDDSGTINDDCVETGEDIEGPFYRAGVPVRSNLDVYGEDGQRLNFTGQVLDAVSCAPLAGAVVEIWHADVAGEYDNDSADHRYRGQIAADADGRYHFQTVVPGRYLNGATYRPAHIHLKVWVDGVERLTTQLYFNNDPHSDGDPWFDPDRIVADLQDGDTLDGKIDLVV